jgi:hypothetical protein
MKKNTFLVFGLLVLTVTMVFAQAKPPKAKKVLDVNVPIEESAVIFVPKGSALYQCDDIKFGKVVAGTDFGSLKGAGGDLIGAIAKPILQIPAGEHTIIGTAGSDKPSVSKNRMITYTFLPGHYYQMSFIGKGSGMEMAMQMGKQGFMERGINWCFFDMTEEVKAGKKDFNERYFKAAGEGALGKDHVIMYWLYPIGSGEGSAKSLEEQALD